MLGALFGIGVTAFICEIVFKGDSALHLLYAPMGACAVLLFAVPTSPLAQPWPMIGGNVVSATVGVIIALFVDEPAIAAGLAVSLAILAMSICRCLHPPGGASALIAVMGGPTVSEMGFLFPLAPVGLNAVMLVLTGIVFHRLMGRSYPHVPAPVAVNNNKTSDVPAQLRVGVQRQDIEKALEAFGEGFDIKTGDLERLIRESQFQSQLRSNSALVCADIMSRDVVSARADMTTDDARILLLKHNIRVLPVIDEQGKLLGKVGLRELLGAGERVSAVMSDAVIAKPDDLAVSLLPMLTDGKTHGVVIIDTTEKVVGLITQTDLLSIMMAE